jgi:hypothetical protein
MYQKKLVGWAKKRGDNTWTAEPTAWEFGRGCEFIKAWDKATYEIRR